MRKAAIAAAFLATLLMFPARGQAADLFRAKPAGADFALFPFWKQVLADMNGGPDKGQAAPCADERRCAPAEWTDFIDSLRDRPRREQVVAVNHWVNARPYVTDMANWGVADYWETPGEFLAHGGDCEDYAITKYFTLTRLGFTPDDLHVTVVKDRVAGAFHAVLAVRLDGDIWLLDNQAEEPAPLADAVRYTPVYSLNARGFWLHSLPTIGLPGVTLVAAGTPARAGALGIRAMTARSR